MINESRELVDQIVFGMEEKKAKNIVCIDLREIENSICDYFVVCHGDSTTQVEAIANSVLDEVRKKLGDKPWHKEGYQNSEWILLDYVNVVGHVFLKDKRLFYNLEDLWADAPVEAIGLQEQID
ncbi:MAG: ribosome silencing factor [Flavobacteriales bacterium]|nr:ribosome silencing factor [Flavobacteriales bacterium]